MNRLLSVFLSWHLPCPLEGSLQSTSLVHQDTTGGRTVAVETPFRTVVASPLHRCCWYKCSLSAAHFCGTAAATTVLLTAAATPALNLLNDADRSAPPLDSNVHSQS